jgi:hypothetical protein
MAKATTNMALKLFVCSSDLDIILSSGKGAGGWNFLDRKTAVFRG